MKTKKDPEAIRPDTCNIRWLMILNRLSARTKQYPAVALYDRLREDRVEVTAQSMHNTMKRLESHGLVDSAKENGRLFFKITKSGRTFLRNAKAIAKKL